MKTRLLEETGSRGSSTWTRRRCPTSGSAPSSPAAIRRSRRRAQVALMLRTLGWADQRGDRPWLSPSPRRRWPSCSSGAQSATPGPGCDPRLRGAAWRHPPPDRLAAAPAVVDLIFNEGYGGRGDLATEAIRLAGALAQLMLDEPDVHGAPGADADELPRRDARLLRRRRRPSARPGRRAPGRRPDRGGPGGARSRHRPRRPRGATCCRRRSWLFMSTSPRTCLKLAALYGVLRPRHLVDRRRTEPRRGLR